MGAKYEGRFIFNYNINLLYQLLTDIKFLMDMNFSINVNNYQPQTCLMRYNHSMTFTSWGEKITILLTALNDSQTSVSIESKCMLPTQIIDYGKNRKNVDQINAYIVQNIGAFTMNQQHSTSQQYAPYPNSQSVYCWNCGCALSVNSGNFCSCCGAKLR